MIFFSHHFTYPLVFTQSRALLGADYVIYLFFQSSAASFLEFQTPAFDFTIIFPESNLP